MYYSRGRAVSRLGRGLPMGGEGTIRERRPGAATLLAGAFLLLSPPAFAATLTAQPGDDIAAIVATMQDGDELQLAAGSYAGGIFIQGRSIAILGPEAGEATITAPEGTNVLLAVLEGGNARLERLHFAPTEAAPFAIYVQGSSASCEGCSFADTPSTPIYAEAGTLTLAASSLDRVAGDAVVAIEGSTLIVSDTSFSEISGTAIVAADMVSAALSGLTVAGANGILLTGGSAASSIANSEVVATGQFGIQAQLTAELAIDGTRAQSGDVGMVAILDAGGGFTLSGSTAIGTNAGLHIESRAPLESRGVTVDGNVLLATGSSGTGFRLLGARDVETAGNTIASAGQVGVLLADSSSALLNDNVVSAAEMAVAVTEESPGTGTLENDLLLAPTPLSGGPLTAGPGTTRLSLALETDPAAAEALRTELAALLQAETLGNAAVLTRIADGAAALREQVTGLSTVRLLVTDAAGREAPAPFVVLAEDGSLVADSPAGELAALAPGSYRIAAAAAPGLATEVSIAPGEAAEVKLSLPRSLWVALRYKTDTEPSDVLFIALPEDEMRSLVQNNGYDWRLEEARAFPRPEATDADIAEALDLARDAVARLHALPTENTDDIWRPAMPLRYEARRILAAHGAAEDARLILDNVWGALGDLTTATFAAAYLEARLGLLSSGAVYEALQSDDPETAFAAATAMHLLGADEGTAHLRASLDDPAYAEVRHQILYLLRAVDDDAVAAAYRQQLVEFVEARERGEEQIYLPLEAFTYVLVFGNEEDWPLLGNALVDVHSHSNTSAATLLARFAADPGPFTDVLASFVTEHDVGPQVHLCSHFRARGPQRFHELNEQMQDQISSWWTATSPNSSSRYDTYVQYYLEAGGCWPNAKIAEFFYSGESELQRVYLGQRWVPEPWHEEELLQNAAAGSLGDNYVELLGFVEPERLSAALQGSAAHEPALKVAYRKVVSRVNYDPTVHFYEDGIERRPFLLRNVDTENYSGSTSGMVLVDPQLGADGRLVLRLRIEQIPHYQGYCDLGAKIATNCSLSAWKNHAFTQDQGAPLIKSIRLLRDGEEVPLTITGPHALGLRIDAGPSPRGYAGLVLVVDLELIDDRRTLIFDLFASAKARGLGGG